jgi:hypothetical protein
VVVAFVSIPAPEAGAIVQVTPCWEESFCRVAVRAWVPPADTVLDVGATETVIAGGGGDALLSPPQLTSAGVTASATQGMAKRRRRFMHQLP